MTTQTSIAGSINSVVNQPDNVGMSSRVLQAIKDAAEKTGVDFTYLVNKASQESSFDPLAKSVASSATGLYQFTRQTWLHMVKDYGAQFGLADYAAKIVPGANGHLTINDPTAKQAVLALRNDPQVSAVMAGELDKENATSLKAAVGGKIGATELYLAHFLGAGGASSFISAMRSDPSASAAAYLPTAAAANPSVFYGKDGQPRSLQQIYQHFAQKFETSTQRGTTQLTSNVAKQKNPVPVLSTASVTSVLAANMSPVPKSNALYSTVADGTPLAQGLRATTGAGAINLSGSSTLFAAMVLGQMNGIESTRTTEALSQNDNKKNKALSVLAGIA